MKLCVYVFVLVVLVGAGVPAVSKKTTKKSPDQKSRHIKRKVADYAEKENTGNTLPAPTSQMFTVNTPLKSFTVTYGNQGIAIKGYKLDLSLKREPCNAHIIDRFNEETETQIQEMIEKNILKTKTENKTIQNIMVQIGENQYFVNNHSEASKLFRLLPTEFLRMKWEEKFNCEDNNSQ